MAITKAQQSALTNSSFAAGGVWSPTTVSITGVTAGNLLVVVSGLWDSGRGTGVPQGIHSDSNGTLVGATNANPNLNAAGSPPGWPVAPQISHILSAAAGTHTITPVVVNSGGDGYLSAIEFSGGGAGTWTQVDGGTGYAGSSTIGAVDGVTATTVGTAAQVGDLVISVTAVDGDPTALGMSSPSNGSWNNLVTTSTTGDSVTIGAAYRIATVAGAQSAVWDSVDAACQQNFAAIAVYRFTPSGPTINTQPANAVAKVGATAGISVSATASAGSLSYQWQQRTSGAWSDIGGATSASYNTPTLAAGDSAGYRCNVTDSNGTVATNEAVLTVALPQKLWRRQPTALTASRPFEALQGKVKSALVSTEFFGASAATGSSSSTLSLAGSAAGTAPAVASSSLTITMSGVSTATGGGAATGDSAVTIALVGASTAAAPASATSAGTVLLGGSAAGSAPAIGASAGTIVISGAAVGNAPAAGASALIVALTGSAAGTARVTATTAGTVALSGSAAAAAGASGSSSGAIALAAGSAAAAPAAAASAGTVSLSGSANAAAGATAASSGTVGLSVSSAAVAIATAGSAGTVALAGASTATTGNSATAASALTISLTGSASGIAPTAASSTATIALAGAAAAIAAAAASSAAPIALTAAGTGQAKATGASAASIDLAAAAVASVIARAYSAVTIEMAAQSAANGMPVDPGPREVVRQSSRIVTQIDAESAIALQFVRSSPITTALTLVSRIELEDA